MKTGIELMSDERQRQIEKKGWSLEHDDSHVNGELAQAAIAYVLEEMYGGLAQDTEAFAWFPWELRWWKPKDRISNLVRAGAFLAAEIDRLQRAASVPSI